MLGTLFGTYSWHIYFSDEILLYGVDVHAWNMVWHRMYIFDDSIFTIDIYFFFMMYGMA